MDEEDHRGIPSKAREAYARGVAAATPLAFYVEEPTMKEPKLDWVAGSVAQFDYYDLEARIEATFDVSIIVSEPWVFRGRDDGEYYGAVMVGAVALDSAGYPFLAASAMGIGPSGAGVVDAHGAALNGLRTIEEQLIDCPIPFVPTPVVK